MNFGSETTSLNNFHSKASMEQTLYPPGLYPPGLIPPYDHESGNVPAGYDSSISRSIYVGNIHPMATESHLVEIFGSVGPLESCKLIRKERSSFGFVDYWDHPSAAAALHSLNGKLLLGFPLKVNWAFTSGQREDTSSHFNIFVGDLSPEVTDPILRNSFGVYHSCSDARVMWDQRSGRSRGFGFVSFRKQADAERAILEMNGQWIGNRAIRCNWATKSTQSPSTAGSSPPFDGSQMSELKSHWNFGSVPLLNSSSAEAQAGFMFNLQPPPNNSTVYVGNLAPEVTDFELHQQFSALGIGTVEDVRVQKDKGFGFVKFSAYEEAAAAIQLANGRMIWGRPIKCSWGNKRKPVVPGLSFPGTQSFNSAQGFPFSAGITGFDRPAVPTPVNFPDLSGGLPIGLSSNVSNGTSNSFGAFGGSSGSQHSF